MLTADGSTYTDEHKFGNTYERSWVLTDAATGNPLSGLGTAHFRLHVRDQKGNKLLAATDTDGAPAHIVVTALTALVELTFSATEMSENLPDGVYDYDLEVTMADGTVFTPFAVNLTILPTFTRGA